MRWTSFLACSALTCSILTVAGAQSTTTKAPSTKQKKETVTAVQLPPSPSALLPETLDGWVADAPAKSINDPAQADPSNATALKEYDFTGGAAIGYKRDGDTLTVRALRFQDTSGAYGAYSFYRANNWVKEDIGSGAASYKNRVLFWKGDTVVDATFSQIGPMSAAEMRELANRIPSPPGNKALMPPVLAALPKGNLQPLTTHYADGPAGYVGAGGVLPADLVGFDRGAETATANYSLASGPATLTIIDYPTPQMAEAVEPKIRDYIKAGSKAQPAWPKPLVDSDVASLEVRRSGPLVVLVSGDAIPDESHRLVQLVHYDADLISIPQPTTNDVTKTAELLMGIAGIVIVGGSAALLLGFFLGGGRALYRVVRGKPASSVYDEEFIHIDLRTKWEEPLAPLKEPNPKG